MLTNNALPMLAAVTSGGSTSWNRSDRREPWAGRGLKRGITGRRSSPVVDRRTLKKAERIELARELDAWTTGEQDIAAPVLVRVEDEFGWHYDVLDYEADRRLADEFDAEALLFEEFGLDDEASYTDLAAAVGVTRMGDRYSLDEGDLPGWGNARVAYEDFKSGFRITDRP